MLTQVPPEVWMRVKAECCRRRVSECDGVAEALRAWVGASERAREADRGEIPAELAGVVTVGPSREVRPGPGELF